MAGPVIELRGLEAQITSIGLTTVGLIIVGVVLVYQQFSHSRQ